MLIGFAGYARSGKTTAAQILEAEHGFVRDSFASTLREFVEQLDPLVQEPDAWDYGCGDYEHCEPANYGGYAERLSSVLLDCGGWEGVKNSSYADDVRRILQRLGTEAGRGVLGEDVWVDALFHRQHHLLTGDSSLTIDDVRFPNEAKRIQNEGGIVVVVSRPGVGAVNGHESERALDGFPFDCVVVNDGGRDQLKSTIQALINDMEGMDR